MWESHRYARHGRGKEKKPDVWGIDRRGKEDPLLPQTRKRFSSRRLGKEKKVELLMTFRKKSYPLPKKGGKKEKKALRGLWEAGGVPGRKERGRATGDRLSLLVEEKENHRQEGDGDRSGTRSRKKGEGHGYKRKKRSISPPLPKGKAPRTGVKKRGIGLGTEKKRKGKARGQIPGKTLLLHPRPSPSNARERRKKGRRWLQFLAKLYTLNLYRGKKNGG